MGEDDIWWERMKKEKEIKSDEMEWDEKRWKARWWEKISLAERRCTEKWYDVRWEDERRDVKWNDLKWGDEMTRHGTGWSRVNVLWGKMTQCDKMTWYEYLQYQPSGDGVDLEEWEWNKINLNEITWDFKITWEEFGCTGMMSWPDEAG